VGVDLSSRGRHMVLSAATKSLPDELTFGDPLAATREAYELGKDIGGGTILTMSKKLFIAPAPDIFISQLNPKG